MAFRYPLPKAGAGAAVVANPKRRVARGRRNPDLVAQIRPGDLVTIVNRFGQKQRGRAVMRSDPRYGPGWVLNMGGRHGTPGLANAENIVKVQASKARHGGGSVPPQPRQGNPSRVPASAAPFIKRWILGKGARDARRGALTTGQTHYVLMRPDGGAAHMASQASRDQAGMEEWKDWPVVSTHRPPAGGALAKGAGIEEREHPYISREAALKIARDHLRADPAYYAKHNPRRRRPSTAEGHRLEIAKRTVRMAPAMRGVMGGPSLEEAKRTIAAAKTGRRGRRNPLDWNKFKLSGAPSPKLRAVVVWTTERGGGYTIRLVPRPSWAPAGFVGWYKRKRDAEERAKVYRELYATSKNPLTKREVAQATEWIGSRQRDVTSAPRGDQDYLQGQVDGMADVMHALRPYEGPLDPRGPQARRSWSRGRNPLTKAETESVRGKWHRALGGAGDIGRSRWQRHHVLGKAEAYEDVVQAHGARTNPPPVLITLNPGETGNRATQLWRKFHGPQARGTGNPKVTRARGGSGNGRATIIHLGGAKELKLRDHPVLKLHGYTAYASPNGRRCFLAAGVPKFGAKAQFIGMGQHVTYSGPRYSRAKRPGGHPTWWKHDFAGGVRVFRTAGSNPTYVVEGGRFRVTDWMRG